MYFEMYRRFMGIRPPFHNHVLRGNYDLTAASLCKVIRTSLSMLNPKALWCCPDGFEAGDMGIKERRPFPAGEPKKWAKILTMDEKNRCLGIFDEEFTFYLRTGITPAENVARGEARGGFFELYGNDREILSIYEALKEKFDGFFVLESAKKHLDEIWT